MSSWLRRMFSWRIRSLAWRQYSEAQDGAASYYSESMVGSCCAGPLAKAMAMAAAGSRVMEAAGVTPWRRGTSGRCGRR